MLAINQDVTAAGQHIPQSYPTPPPTAVVARVYARALSDGSVAVAFYNREDATSSAHVDFSKLGWPAGTIAAARDLWAHKDLGEFTDRFPASGDADVEPHATMLLRLTPRQLATVA